MTGISETFRELKERNEAALIAYLTVGDPDLTKTPKLAGALIDGGADIIELGIPFSDPIADGPTIQNATSRSLMSGTRPLDALRIARAINEKYDNPLVLMPYYNPIFRLGLGKFVDKARRSGISGIVVPDLPVEESQEYKKECLARGIDTIFLASPSTTHERLKQILSQTSGYLYLVSLYGVTGARTTVSNSAVSLVETYGRLVRDTVPLAVGFGISKPEHVSKIVRAGADGVIVGSAFVKLIEENQANMNRAALKLKGLAHSLKKATKTETQH
jgi:tryptophan synthase alpha chain